MGEIHGGYEYDNAGRTTLERDFVDHSKRYVYDPAGNVIRYVTPRGDTIRTEYDELNRLVKRTTPAVTYAGSGCIAAFFDDCRWKFPLYPNNSSGGYTIPEDVAYFTYDVMGNQLTADNLDAKVSRSYYPNGALRGDTIRMRTYSGTGYSTHVYGLEYGADAAGRFSWLQHPSIAGSGQRDSIFFSDTTGAMTRVRDRMGNQFSFAYDLLGRPTVTTMPGGILDETTYDIEGRRIARREYKPNVLELHSETFRYDARGKLRSASNWQSTFTNWYSGLGNLVGTDWSNVFDNGRTREEFETDALGHTAWNRSTNSMSGDQPEFDHTFAHRSPAA